MINNDVSEINNYVTPEENIIIYKTNNDLEQQFVASNQIVDTPVSNTLMINSVGLNNVSETNNWVSQEENNVEYDDFSQANNLVTQEENIMTQNSQEWQQMAVNNQIAENTHVINNEYGYVSGNQNWVSEKENRILNNHHSFRRVNEILYRNKLNFNNLKVYLNKLIPYRKWDITDNKLLDNILYVLRYKTKSDFSILINKLYNHELYNDYNALYYLLGIKGSRPVVFNMSDFIRNQFYKNTEYRSSVEERKINSNLFTRVNSVLQNHILNYNVLRAILSKMRFHDLVNKSDNELLSAILHVLQSNNGSKFSTLIHHLFNHEFYKGYNALYYILGIKAKSEIAFNVWDFLMKTFLFNKLGSTIINNSDDFIGCQLFKILKKTFPAIDEPYISKIVLNTVVDYMRQNNLYSQRIKQLPMLINSQYD